ncbi:MAG: 50S ribosomal protein L25 [Fimbriimonadales bacterium]|jgi:large subunit ribosomal protein L25|nr:50S ribosomal protein L25 [Armatimonadota bacterium]MCX7687022.1 50S ribosomal protein L25 [Fimbriimonadales bacterium]CUU11500.1 large subunit ribosomal protein L25 [Armatimonadetes bacterium GBS]CUU36221.1 large subunit ribosomal protein L25 [Armatimonadetes bacterium DC]CUU37014.1 large subunit ribosomal protein L25 [Armatimonadetes bacterium GXS]GBC90237.1 50S ribosomal protein L25 [bacterium HR14]
MTKSYTLKAEPRTLLGKKARRLLRQGWVPGVVFTSNGESHPAQFRERELTHVLHLAGTSHLIEVELNGTKFTTLLREVDREPITTRIRHVSLWAMPMDEPIEATVPIVFVGESDAVKSGGTLVHPLESLTVRCLPKDLPEAITVDISGLVNFHDSIHVRDLTLPPGVQVMEDPDATVVTVTPPKGVEEEEAAEETTESAPEGA